MKFCELRKELSKHGLKTSGNKSELITRLEDALSRGSINVDINEEDKEPEEDIEGNTSEDEDDEDEDERTFRRQPKAVLTFKDVEESMSTFSGEDNTNVRNWIEEFEEMALLCDWVDVQKIVYAKRLLRGSAKLFVRHEKRGETWSRLKKALTREFSKVVSSHKVHKELARQKKKSDESYEEYTYRMLDIAAQADVEIESTIQYIIDGIRDDEVNKTVLYGARTIRQLKTKFSYLRDHADQYENENQK